MQTSCYLRLKLIAPPAYPVAISVGLPRWYKGDAMRELAPTREMLKMSHEEYEAFMRARLVKLDPEEMYRRLGPDAVLLCWEQPFQPCHRRMVAEWFEDALGIAIPEVGYTREQTPSYTEIQRPARQS